MRRPATITNIIEDPHMASVKVTYDDGTKETHQTHPFTPIGMKVLLEMLGVTYETVVGTIVAVEDNVIYPAD